MDLSVVIPVYNEGANVKPLYDELMEVLPSIGMHEIIFVDDGSTDNTFEILSGLKVKVIKLRRNFGQSAALHAGFTKATGDLVVSMDGDLQDEPKDIPLIIQKLRDENLDAVCGWRHDRKDSLSKRFFSRASNILRSWLLKDKIHDSGCSLRAYRQACVKDLELFGEMHRYIPAILSWKGMRIGEVKVRHKPRVNGRSNYGAARLLKGTLDLFNIWFWRKYSARPLHIFGGFGMIFAGIGIIFGLYSVYLKLFQKSDLSNTVLPIIAVFLVILGIQFALSGILADIVIKNYYRGRDAYNIETVIENEDTDA